MANSLKYKFLQFLRRYQLIQPGQRVLVAVSGGMDSMALLNLLLEWGALLKPQLSVLHINHQLRGAQSEEEAEFVRQYCKQRDIPFFLRKINVRDFAREHNLSLEEAGHMLREQVFQQIARAQNFDRVATAHHLNDQVETILMRLIKGAGLEGLAGIRVQKGILIRPLLFASRVQIEEYVKGKNIPFKEDPSNRDKRYYRNRIRLELLPFIQEKFAIASFDHFLFASLIIQEWLERMQDELAEIWRKEVKRLSPGEIALDKQTFESLFSGVQIRLLEKIAAHLTGRNSSIHFNRFWGIKDWIKSASPGSSLRFGELIVVNQEQMLLFKTVPGIFPSFRKKIYPGKEYRIAPANIRLRLEWVAPEDVQLPPPAGMEYVDAQSLRFPLILRPWKPGDKFTPLGMQQEKLVSDFLTDLKIKFPEKKNVVLLESEGKIVYILNYRINDEVKLKPGTKKILRILIQPL